ncbi:ribosome silencing factor [Bartonella apihabitans]|uniref:ribosome silencing factor n=1 Tax=Bartonella apihabitans TaxID=2750929 RepID=UPI0039984A25
MNNLKKTIVTQKKNRIGKDAAAQENLQADNTGLIVENNLQRVLSSLDDSKAEDVVTIDLRGRSPLADYMVIASGGSQRHVSALAYHLLYAMKDCNKGQTRVEGLSECDWVLIDLGDIIVHLFRPETREFYNLEKMWNTSDAGDRIHLRVGEN